MKSVTHIVCIIVLGMLISSCTSARWTIEDKNATDRSQREILQQDQFLIPAQELRPENPTLRLNLLSRTKYRFSQRILAQRNIQDYRLRPGFIALGLSGAAIAFVAANSTAIGNNKSPTRVWALNTVGALLAASGFLNLKPVGEPRSTGEERFLKNSGSITQVDTVQVQQDFDANTTVTIVYEGENIYREESSTIPGGQLTIPLGEELNELEITGKDPGSVQVKVGFEDSLYSYNYPVADVLQPYARVTSQLATLRNSTDETTDDNIVADLVEGSQVQIQSSDSEQWYQVLYGISEHYIRKENAEIVWRSSGFVQEDQVVTVPRLPFGEVDVESNIPILRSPQQNAMALIVTNQEYSGTYQQRNYAHRDGQLIKTYLQTALGYPKENIYEINDLRDSDTLNRLLAQMRVAANDSTELTVFLSGYGAVNQEEDEASLSLLGVNEEGEEPPSVARLDELFGQFSTITAAQTLILSDIDFSQSSGNYSANQAQQILESNVDELNNGEQSAVLFGTQLNQPTSLYVSSSGDDKKHHIFPYFFAKALQQRMTNLSAIYQYLERNVSYTARRLHDQPQDPLLLGNTLLDLRN